MAKFITGKELQETITDIIWEANQTLLILSPYIKLDDYFKKIFDKQQNIPKLHIIIAFGKNEDSIHRSLSKSDFDYFKKFPNISIIYVPNLHAKYYGNEAKGVVTSINMYDYSFKNNIEFGVFTEQSILNQFGYNLDSDIWYESLKIVEENNAVYIKRPVYESKSFIINFSKNYIKSDVLHDSTDYFYEKAGKLKKAKLGDFPAELELNSIQGKKPSREDIIEEKPTEPRHRHIQDNYGEYGYCIRTGEKIPFNPRQPMTREAWRIWNEYKNYDFGEKYCHKTGKPSYGRTSMNNPILYQ